MKLLQRHPHSASVKEKGAGSSRGTHSSRARIGGWLRRYRPVLLVVSAALVAGSFFLPFWSITLHSPQYPGGLSVYITGLGAKGRVPEVDELNHYIGFMRVEDIAKSLRALWPYGVVLLAVILLVAAFLKGRFWGKIGALLALAAATYPVIFAVMLYHYLDYAGHHLDPHAALSTSVSPFMPAYWGTKMVGQFKTTGAFGLGFWLIVLAFVLEVTAAVVAWRKAPSS